MAHYNLGSDEDSRRRGAPRDVHAPAARGRRPRSCFLLYEVGVGDVRRRPAEICTTRLLPASTFKIPHALAALDAGVLSGADEKMAYDGAPPASRRGGAITRSPPRCAIRSSGTSSASPKRLGMDREREYLKKFDYGNADPTSGLTTFWLGGSLQITPEEQLRFMRRLYADELAASPAAVRTVRQLLVQPQGHVVERHRPSTRSPPRGLPGPSSVPKREAAPIGAARTCAGWWGMSLEDHARGSS